MQHALNFVTNKAVNDGGIYLEMDSKVKILKSIASNFTEKHKIVKFTADEANYGGAVYVSDDGMCAYSASDNKYCSFQALALYGSAHFEPNAFQNRCILFEKNIARTLGKSLYGGLLDRYKVSPLSELLHNITSKDNKPSSSAITVGGIAYFHSISNIENSDIACFSTSSSLFL